MAAILSRRLASQLLHRNTTPLAAALIHSKPHPQPLSPTIPIHHPNPNPNPNPFQSLTIPILRRFSSTPTPHPPSSPPPPPELRHQEIVGPTVDRDVSALADEARVALESVRKSIYNLSSALALLGFAHLGLGAWIAYARPAGDEVSVQGLMAFAFPFAMAFLMRRTLKPISFFRKMEEQGRLQLLTLTLQVSKSLNLMFVRMRVASVCCVVAISAGSLAALCLRSS